MKLLMHMCCANCSIYPLQTFLLMGISACGYWFNPNIHPYTEYTQRLDALSRLQKLWGFDVEYNFDYPLDEFLQKVAGLGPERCTACYAMRLEQTAVTAKKMNYDGFTTSLLASPYQKFDIIVKTGSEAGRRNGIPFISQDMRQGWSLSRTYSRELGLYRQKYCGCIYSEMERFRKDRQS